MHTAAAHARSVTAAIALRMALAAALCMSACPGAALAQVAPTQTYYPRGRPLIVQVDTPYTAPTAGANGEATGEPEIELIDPATGAVSDRAPVEAGRADLGSLFPRLWTDRAPRVLYAQLRVGGARVGPAMVLQPLVSPARAGVDEREPRTPLIIWPPSRQPKPVHTGWRAYVDMDLVLETEAGDITIRLRPDAAPNTAWTVRSLAEGGFYDGVTFHRIIALGPVKGEPFVVQTGDPSGTGEGGPGFEIALENSTLKHDYGVVSLARQAREANSGGSQFFICLSRTECARLDGQYAAFGQVIGGMDVALTIARAPVATGSSDRPARPVRIVRAALVEAAPFGHGPAPERIDGGGDGR